MQFPGSTRRGQRGSGGTQVSGHMCTCGRTLVKPTGVCTVLHVGFFGGRTCWVCLQSRSVIRHHSCNTAAVGGPCFSSWFLAIPVHLTFADLGWVKLKWTFARVWKAEEAGHLPPAPPFPVRCTLSGREAPSGRRVGLAGGWQDAATCSCSLLVL